LRSRHAAFDAAQATRMCARTFGWRNILGLPSRNIADNLRKLDRIARALDALLCHSY